MQGFYKKPELELLIQRRTTRKSLATALINEAIVDRYYQKRTIRHIAEAFEKDHQRKALTVMATGAGKTRTVIALIELLMRCNWVKRVLFLADRVALVRQATKQFSKFLPDSSPVNLVTEKNTEGRVYLSTYPTMMGLIDDAKDGQKRFGVGHFDLLVIDEAHRSVYQKYGAIFEYFDALLVGLTATPKDEIDHNTYGLFDLERGVPTDAYALNDAVADGFLAPPKAVSVPLKFQREGMKYNERSEAEQEQWDALEWNEDGEIPDEVAAPALNQWLFNTDTVDKVLEHVMTHGLKVAGGDRLGKTIIFAKNNDHAEFIAERFHIAYPHHKGQFARVITYKTEYAQSLIDNFSDKDKMPHIAISVDMLDTGIDVPEVVNLVFFKAVRSKTKFWQMIGRGTRLCPNLFEPGKHKEFFYLFDYCQNLEFFSQNMEGIEGQGSESLGTRLFKARLQLIATLDQKFANGQAVQQTESKYGDSGNDATLRIDLADLLHQQVSAMNVGNFVVRPQRKLVEQYAKAEAWQKLGVEQISDLGLYVAGLPTELAEEGEEAKRFDMLLLRTQLAVLQATADFAGLRDKIKDIAQALEAQQMIPAVKIQLVLIQSLMGDEWWEDVTVAMLETVRKRLRLLIRLIEKGKRTLVYTDFEDELGDGAIVAMPEIGTGTNFQRFRDKARQFLKKHESHLSLQRLRRNQPLTVSDLAELERMLIEAGGTKQTIDRAKLESEGLGVFIRSLVGLEHDIAKQAFGQFISGVSATASQIEFINLVVDYLTENGVMAPDRLYESPFTDINAQGIDGVFPSASIDQIVEVLGDIRRYASG